MSRWCCLGLALMPFLVFGVKQFFEGRKENMFVSFGVAAILIVISLAVWGWQRMRRCQGG